MQHEIIQIGKKFEGFVGFFILFSVDFVGRNWKEILIDQGCKS
jgi:hypothetical protein